MTLGSIFARVTPGAPRGADLRYSAEIHPDDLGRDDGIPVRIPLRLTTDDGLVVDRVRDAEERDDQVWLYLPRRETPFELRLRGRGAACVGGAPGDLIVRVTARADAPVRARHQRSVVAPVAGWIAGGVLIAILGALLLVCA